MTSLFCCCDEQETTPPVVDSAVDRHQTTDSISSLVRGSAKTSP
jgi:hypothetical protein